MSRTLVWVDLYMTHEDKVFFANVVVIDLTQEIMTTSVISWLASVVAKLNAIVKICKCRRFHEGPHFIPMAIKVHGAPKCDMDCFIKECVHLFHDRWFEGHLSLSFCIQFFKQHVIITFQCALTFVIQRKIVLARDVYSRPPITFKFHNLYASNIRGVVGEIASYHEKDYLFPFFGSCGLHVH
jgi:hypothetical protein